MSDARAILQVVTSTTANRDIVGLVVRDFPADLKTTIAERAEQEGTTFRALAANAIAESYGVAWRATGRRSAGVSDAPDVELRMPRSLRRKLNQTAAAADTSARAVVLDILTAAFGRKTRRS